MRRLVVTGSGRHKLHTLKQHTFVSFAAKIQNQSALSRPLHFAMTFTWTIVRIVIDCLLRIIQQKGFF